MRYIFSQVNETALSVVKSEPILWLPSPRSVRHPASLTAVSRYSIHHLDTEVRQKESVVLKIEGNGLIDLR